MKSGVELFLKATGNYRDITSKDIFFEEVGKLIPLLQEEVDELKESYNLRYVQGVLDDFVDIQVYTHQLASLLERLGCDVDGARQVVTENNSLKYTPSFELASKWLEEHAASCNKFGGTLPYYIAKNEYDGETHYCLKRIRDGKVSKYVGFPKVDLDDYTPKEYGGNL